jgi:hypothetical protein
MLELKRRSCGWRHVARPAGQLNAILVPRQSSQTGIGDGVLKIAANAWNDGQNLAPQQVATRIRSHDPFSREASMAVNRSPCFQASQQVGRNLGQPVVHWSQRLRRHYSFAREPRMCHLPFDSVTGRCLVVVAAACLAALSADRAAAEQFVLFDVTFTFTKEDADNSKPSKSHYYVKGDLINPERPKDWTQPVDYRNGTVHIRTEVLEKPAGGEPTTWSLCYIPNKGRKNGYGCTGTVVYREAGVYEQDVSMKSFWENDSIVWSEGIKQMDLVIKDNSGGSGHAHKRPDHEKFFPTKVRITMVQVSAGAKYDPSLVPNLPASKQP